MTYACPYKDVTFQTGAGGPATGLGIYICPDGLVLVCRLGSMGPVNQTDWENYSMALAERFRTIRAEMGISQEALAALAGISSYTYQKFEKGHSRPGSPANPRLRTLLALSVAMNVPIDELLPKYPAGS